VAQGEDSLSAFDAQLAALRRKTEAGLAARAKALEDAAGRARRGDRAALEEVRRAAHKIRGIAMGQPRLEALMREVETAAAEGRLATVAEALAEARAVAAAAKRTDSGSAAAPAASPEGATARKPRVLVVDDDRAILRMMHLALGRMGGFEVRTAATGDEALAALEAEPFDVILLDAMMPTTTGPELCARARALPRQRGARLVILSAATPEQLGAGGSAPDAWWRKPLPPKELVRRVRALLAPPES